MITVVVLGCWLLGYGGSSKDGTSRERKEVSCFVKGGKSVLYS